MPLKYTFFFGNMDVGGSKKKYMEEFILKMSLK
jgi:hypothetical protein